MALSNGIKANAPDEVNSRSPIGWTRGLCFAIALTCLALIPSSPRAEDSPPPAPDPSAEPSLAPEAPEPTEAPLASPEPEALASPNPESTDEPLPDIEARDFASKVVRRSTSGQTYLFDDVSDVRTHPGKLLLLRREAEPIMAFRVLKVYAEKKQFAAKRVRNYGTIHSLEVGDSYMALEKVGDVPPPPPTLQDKADLKELETVPPPPSAEPSPEPSVAPSAGPEVRPFDSDLDAGTSPPPNGAVDSPDSKDKAQTDDDDADAQPHLGVTVEELNDLDTNLQWLTASLGYFNNEGNYFWGGGVRYGVTLGRMIFLKRPHVQDSLVAEGGLFLYKIINLQAASDSYTILPAEVTLRYNVLFNESFSVFFYAGVMQNFVIQAQSSDQVNEPIIRQELQSTEPAVGGGLSFRIGPNWQARVGLGYDMLDVGLVLRF